MCKHTLVTALFRRFVMLSLSATTHNKHTHTHTHTHTLKSVKTNRISRATRTPPPDWWHRCSTRVDLDAAMCQEPDLPQVLAESQPVLGKPIRLSWITKKENRKRPCRKHIQDKKTLPLDRTLAIGPEHRHLELIVPLDRTLAGEEH